VDGATALPNPNGTAPGQWLALDNGRLVILVPGPPGEMKPLFQQEVLPRLAKLLPQQAIATLTLRIAGMGESDVDALVAPVYKRYENPVTTILAKAGDITLHFRAQCPEPAEAERLVKELGDQVRPLLGNKIYSDDGAPLEQAVLRLLEARGETVALAESLTAGMLGARFAAIPGASKSFVGGLMVYTNEQKERLLGVEAGLIQKHGAVSEPVAIDMARGAMLATRADWAVSLTGYAGPDGGTETDPVGTVFIGLASKAGLARAQRFRFPAGDRDRVRQFATQAGLNLLRLELI
jgi:nicotinamide-nucleotide amidase